MLHLTELDLKKEKQTNSSFRGYNREIGKISLTCYKLNLKNNFHLLFA